MTGDETRAPAARPLRPGDPSQLGRYRVIGRLGEGGMGSVYLADAGDGQPVALKVIRADLAGDTEFRRRFRSEVASARQVPPFCTAEVLDADPDHDPPFLVVEYVDGPSLSAVVRERGPLTPANVHALAIGVATALTAIHGAGVVHRDLKPGNVLLALGSPKVIDFGIARAVEGLDGSDDLTATGVHVGTAAYMAPERFDPASAKTVTSAADIFSWGAVVTYAATGRVPFPGESAPAVAYRIMTEPPQLDGLDPALRILVEQAMSKDPADRPSARALLDRLIASQPCDEGEPATMPVVTVSPDDAATTMMVAAAAPRSHHQDDAGRAGQQVGPLRSAQLAKSAPRQVAAPSRVTHTSWWNRTTTIALVLLLFVITGGVVGIATGKLRLPAAAGAANTPATGDATRASPSESPSPASSGVPSIAAGAQLVLRDSLGASGNWKVVDDLANNAKCAFADGAMQVTKKTAFTFRCQGPTEAYTDFSVFVDVALTSPGSCAGIWYRFNTAGYALRICPDRYELKVHGQPKGSDINQLKAFRLDSQLQSTKPMRVGISVHGGQFAFYRDGVLVGNWTDTMFTSGKIILGIFEAEVPGQPSYTVSFSNIEIWSAAA